MAFLGEEQATRERPAHGRPPWRRSDAPMVEAVAHYLSRGGFHGRHSAQTGEGGLAPQPLGIVPGHRQICETKACSHGDEFLC